MSTAVPGEHALASGYDRSTLRAGLRPLLLAGIAVPILYATGDLAAGLARNGYSFRDQTISELGAIGAPTRMLFGVFITAAWAALVALALGVRRAAAGRRQLVIAGTLLLMVGVMALTVGWLVPMRPRGEEQGLLGLLHLVEGGVAMVLVLGAMGFAAAGLGRGFRAYTTATVIVMLAFGAWAAVQAPLVEAGAETPWLGVVERIYWYAYHLWFAGLGLELLRDDATRIPST
jgi:hypothetical protein